MMGKKHIVQKAYFVIIKFQLRNELCHRQGEIEPYHLKQASRSQRNTAFSARHFQICLACGAHSHSWPSFSRNLVHTNLNLNGPWWPEGQSDVDAICGLVSYLHIFTQDPTLFLSFSLQGVLLYYYILYI